GCARRRGTPTPRAARARLPWPRPASRPHPPRRRGRRSLPRGRAHPASAPPAASAPAACPAAARPPRLRETDRRRRTHPRRAPATRTARRSRAPPPTPRRGTGFRPVPRSRCPATVPPPWPFPPTPPSPPPASTTQHRSPVARRVAGASDMPRGTCCRAGICCSRRADALTQSVRTLTVSSRRARAQHGHELAREQVGHFTPAPVALGGGEPRADAIDGRDDGAAARRPRLEHRDAMVELEDERQVARGAREQAVRRRDVAGDEAVGGGRETVRQTMQVAVNLAPPGRRELSRGLAADRDRLAAAQAPRRQRRPVGRIRRRAVDLDA